MKKMKKRMYRIILNDEYGTYIYFKARSEKDIKLGDIKIIQRLGIKK